MVFEQIEKLKQEYTDKYVVVDTQQPELARFAERVGQVKTVNMSGRALVEFADMFDNIGWYDIDLDFLKVVDKPPPKAEPAKKPAAKKAPAAAKKPAAPAGTGEKKLSPLELARMQGAAKKDGQRAGAGQATAQQPTTEKPAAQKMSVAEKLAAARSQQQPAGESASGAAPAATASAATESSTTKTESKPAAKSAPQGKVDRSKLSVAEMIAMARGEKSAPTTGAGDASADAAGTAAGEPAAVETVADEAATAEAPAAEPVEEAADPAAAAESAAPAAPSGKVDRASMSVADMIAWCREHDAS